MKWDIDKALQAFEIPLHACGTTITHTLMSVDLMKERGLRPTSEQIRRSFGHIWSLGLGPMDCPKLFFHGQTIREAVLNAKKGIAKLKPNERLFYAIPEKKPKRPGYPRRKSAAKKPAD